MKTVIHLFTAFAILLLTQYVYTQQSPHHLVIKGKVTCQDTGVTNVPITDGVAVVYTNDKGEYTLQSFTDRHFVYYTLPSGYESPIIDGVPVFYKKIEAAGSDTFVADFELQKSVESQDSHAFIVWADPQVHDVEEFELLKVVVADVKETVARYSSKMPVHAISCGDNVFDKLLFFEPYKQVISPIGIPFYHAIGNHDMDYNERSHELSTVSYSQSFGPAHYSFNRGKIHYVVLDDVFYYGRSHLYIGYLDELQLRWLEQDLKVVAKGSTVVVSVHIPTTYGDEKEATNQIALHRNSVMNNKALYKILSPYNTHLMAGHSHTQWNTIISPTIMEHTHVGACAAWWQGEIGTDGTPKGYTVYVAEGDNLQWYFKGVGMPKDVQCKVYPKGSDSGNPEYIIANVFNYDPCWKVYWSENGRRMGEMEQYWGEDPTAKKLYEPGKNKKYHWLGVGGTNHLFRAKPGDSNAKITILVIDRFGNQYEAAEDKK
jgi:hypothetical protein